MEILREHSTGQDGIDDLQRVRSMRSRPYLRVEVRIVPVYLALGAEFVLGDFFEVHEERNLGRSRCSPVFEAIPRLLHQRVHHPRIGEKRSGVDVVGRPLVAAGIGYESGYRAVLHGDERESFGNENE